MKIRNLKIGTRLGLGFSTVVMMTAIVGSMNFQQIENLWDNTENMYRHPLVVSNAVRDIRADIIAMHRSMKDVALAVNGNQVDLAQAKVEEHEKEVYHLFKLVFERFLGDKRDVEVAYEAFSNWKSIRDEVIQLVRNGEKDKAAEITKGKGARHVSYMNGKIQTMIDFANDKAIRFYDGAEETKQIVTATLMVSLSSILFLSVFVGLIISRSITRPIREMAEVSRKIESGNYSARNRISTSDEMGFLAQSINNMAASIQSHHEHLEEMVEKRTSELKKANRQLRQEINERKRAEQVLLLQSQIIDNLAEGVYLIRAEDGIIVYTNPAFARMFGYGQDEMIGKHVSIVNAPTDKDPEETAREISASLNKTGKWQGKICNIKKDGTEFWCYALVTSIDHSEYGRAWISVHTDITERKQAEEALKESEEQFRTLAQTATDAIIGIDKKGEIIIWNGAATRIFGYKANEAIGHDLHDLIVPVQYHEKAYKGLERFVLKGKGAVIGRTTELTALRKDGTEFPVELSISGSQHGENWYATGIIRDITRRKQAEEQIRNQSVLLEKAVQEKQHEMEHLAERLVRQEKLAAIGQISGSIAHELRNPLGAIKQSIFFLNRLYENNKLQTSNAKVKEHLDLLATEIDTSDRVISDLLQMTKIEPITKERTNLRSIISDARAKSHIEDRIQIEIELNPEPFLIWVDPLQIRQVLLNLLSNAAHAISQNGIITIRAKIMNKRKNCLISIQDTGCGIDPKFHSKAFEPLFTIKAKAKGTGLGLSICKQIIENHGGRITLSSQVNRGTTVNITLPARNSRKLRE